MQGPRGWQVIALVWAAVIIAGAVTPTQATVHAVAGGHDSGLTTLAHVGEYAVLSFVLAVALGGWHVGPRELVWAGCLAVGLGVAMELVQGFLPYRDSQLSDALADVAGAALGLVAVSAAARVQARRRRSRPG
jgi:VanZ family protein